MFNKRSGSIFAASLLTSFALVQANVSRASSFTLPAQNCFVAGSANAKINSSFLSGVYNIDTTTDVFVECPVEFSAAEQTIGLLNVFYCDNSTSTNFSAQMCTMTTDGSVWSCGSNVTNTGTGCGSLSPGIPSPAYGFRVISVGIPHKVGSSTSKLIEYTFSET